ncbi:uncharacterized protein LOC109837112 [Asparagus officinalis]|uniref:uncharacterized protein LOC109837112 n=1 Tax=Asparagus officinalis TaxID=4686 RepID=UPI00098E469A|nr:uncharacterized protein LOC109837112 [Asparagus officinalis]
MLPNWRKGGERQEEIRDEDVIIAEMILPVHTSHSRVKNHLLRISGTGIKMCSKSTPENLREFQRTLDQAEARLRASKPKMPILPTSSTASTIDVGGSASMPIGAGESKRRRGFNTVKQAFNMGAIEELDALIGRMFYTGGLSFNLTRNSYYVKAFAYTASNPISGYKPLGYNSMRTTILQREKTHVERLMEPIRGTCQQKGVSIYSDGWADAQGGPSSILWWYVRVRQCS